MSARTVIDSPEFVRSGREQHGAVPVASFERLADVLHDAQGSIDYTVRGGYDERGRPRLKLNASGTLHLQCQRCLAPMEVPLDLANTLLLVAPGEQVERVDDPHAPDAIEASHELDVAALLEDEILLSLPFAPRHAEGACAGGAGDEMRSGAPNASELAAQLAAWKKH